MRTESFVSLPDAAKAIAGRDLSGVEALVAIFNTPDAAQAMQEAA
jgi:molybdopterin biosynthesis enzyme MoaB